MDAPHETQQTLRFFHSDQRARVAPPTQATTLAAFNSAIRSAE
ncbi:hypothetical protein FBY03_11322 [Pseudomonas sp. SJZ079]|nr:hypothetical protein FBY03_11322 [Pseudomonas sp. SJZ079]